MVENQRCYKGLVFFQPTILLPMRNITELDIPKVAIASDNKLVCSLSILKWGQSAKSMHNTVERPHGSRNILLPWGKKVTKERNLLKATCSKLALVQLSGDSIYSEF